jgi:hypothetical protein
MSEEMGSLLVNLVLATANVVRDIQQEMNGAASSSTFV